jgi:hypothetical protein
MWMTDLANGALGGALVAATALLVQKKFENDRAREERQQDDTRAAQERKDAAEKEQRDYQRNRHAAWREERKVAHSQALSALDAVWGLASLDRTRMMMQEIKNKGTRASAEEKSEILFMATDYENEIWEGAIKTLWDRISAVALIGSPQSAQAAKAAQEAVQDIYFFTQELGLGTKISQEQNEKFHKQSLEYRTALGKYLALAKVDLGTDS